MFALSTESLADHCGLKVVIRNDDSTLSFAGVMQGWRNDESFREFFISILRDAPYSAFRWETPAITLATVDHDFEFVLIDDPSLERDSDGDAFTEYFTRGKANGVVTFPNLGRDAVLVVPTPSATNKQCAHLAEFCRHAPKDQQHALWKSVGAAFMHRISKKPVWLNTAGDGVPWLHVRLDDRPKYCAYSPYKGYPE